MNLRELEYLNPKSILDIGSNIGSWSKEAKEVWPKATVFMVEANPECKTHLAAMDEPFIICVLADKMKEVTFYQRKCGGTSTGDSIYRENTDWYNDENVVETKMMAYRLDKIVGDNQYDLIKVDVQSAELDVLRGGVDTVNNAKYIIMEIPVDNEQPYNIGAPTRKEVIEYMGSIGFPNMKILEDIVHPVHRYIIQQDVLFTRE